MFDHVQDYVNDIVAFRRLPLDTQLDLVGDITAYWARQKIEALDRAKKTRVDSVVEAQRYYAIEKQWESYNQNLKKKIELKTAEIRQGL